MSIHKQGLGDDVPPWYPKLQVCGLDWVHLRDIRCPSPRLEMSKYAVLYM